MTRGVLEHDATRYCIVPEARLEGTYWEHGPTFREPLDKTGTRMRDPAGRTVANAVPVFERDIWVAGPLITVKDWPVYPLGQAAMRLPPAVVERIIASTTITRSRTSPSARVQINWNDVVLTRDYTVAELVVGVAAWPPRVIPEWRQFYVLFGPGTAEIAEKRGAAIFTEREPTVCGYDEMGQMVAGDTRVIGGGMGAICRSTVPPRWIFFRSRNNQSVTHGILPIIHGEQGDIRAARAGDRRKASLTAAVTPRAERVTESMLQLSVDFGTSNTAVAVAVEKGETPQLLRFRKESIAVNLTSEAGLDPGASLQFRFSFFPLHDAYSNPMPTVLMEFNEGAAHFDQSCLFPRRAIPGVRLTESGSIRHFARRGYLKQDFKWKDRGDGPEHRRAYLEHLALIVAWELRTQDTTSSRAELDLVMTCPLAFSEEQTESLSHATEAFCGTLATCGLKVEEVLTISESLANFYYVRGTLREGSKLPSERHVVLDIGGGTTDISVFSGRGEVILLDSLYIGGKDLAEHLLAYRITQQARWQPVANLLKLGPDEGPVGVGDKAWTDMVQCLLIGRMGGDAEMAQLAADFNEQNMRDLLGEVIALLTFATLYAIRMAAHAKPERNLPPATKIWVWYAGLGSRLFNLAPLAKGILNRRKSAAEILERSVRELAKSAPELAGVDVEFNWTYGKESVCRGALFARSNAPRHTKPTDAMELVTMWWANITSGADPIAWTDPYELRRAKKLDITTKDMVRTEQLFDCLRVAVDTVGRATYGTDWEAAEKELKKYADKVSDQYVSACSDIREGAPDYPRHPIRFVTDTVKQAVCDLIEPEER